MKYELKVSRHWSVTKTEARSQIRQALLERTQDKNVLDPNNFHKSKEGYFSISHTRGMGGFILSSKPAGFDIEAQTRSISERAYKRITTPTERALGFTALEAWVAKEAAFKALSLRYGIKTMTEVNLIVRNKKSRGSNIEFSFKYTDSNNLQRSGKGIIAPKSRFLLGIACLST